MRPIERIDNFLARIDWDWLLNTHWKDCEHQKINKIIGLLPFFESYWKENPDLRIGQLLINLGFVIDNPQVWNDEESDILKAQGLPPEEYLFWTSVYDKDEKLLENPITKLIKNLDKSHILAIKSHFNKKGVFISPDYVTAFNNVLEKE